MRKLDKRKVYMMKLDNKKIKSINLSDLLFYNR
jgi:hypothetical protein